jgi:hypothetical protein
LRGDGPPWPRSSVKAPPSLWRRYRIAYALSPLIHALLAWLLAWAFLSKPSDRRLAVIAGVACDIDGVFALFNHDLFVTYHHTFGHTFLFGIPVAITAAVLARDRWRTGLVALGAFSLHLLADIVGTDWPVMPLYPASDVSLTTHGVLASGPINLAVAVLVLVAVGLIMYYREVSPFEFLSERLDRWIVPLYVYPLKRRCGICGARAAARCGACGHAVCSKHREGFRRVRCTECARAARATLAP